ncbi:hypothetical protein [Magnetospira sp. QH-2]|uniref:hypothetical protein n=1 Tax=Magnetospira sp. (strain QH-2) TaxID=1288970 RepID=UPI0003E81A87|nr:hypothetical protein [Magnetospira sp. QH-2]CCQ74637.1 putative Orotidine 5'-phosphate decarboxylase [Magnetospira sp. QH-2]
MNPVERALRYPYDQPESSYVLTSKGPRPLVSALPLADRIPVLAVGSNQSAERLADKFPDLKDSEAIPVQRGVLEGFDAVYSAHFTRYGAIPATLFAAPKVRSRLCITWLTEPQLTIMHNTEALGQNYGFERLDDVRFTCEQGPQVHTLFSYISLRGAWAPDGAPIPLAAVQAEGRPQVGQSQMQVQEAARLRIAPRMGLAEFIAGTIEDAPCRAERTARLAADGQPVTL